VPRGVKRVEGRPTCGLGERRMAGVTQPGPVNSVEGGDKKKLRLTEAGRTLIEKARGAPMILNQ